MHHICNNIVDNLSAFSSVLLYLAIAGVICAVYNFYFRRKLIQYDNNAFKAFGHSINIVRLMVLFVVLICIVVLLFDNCIDLIPCIIHYRTLLAYVLSWAALYIISDIVSKILRSSLLDNRTKDILNHGLQTSILLVVTILVGSLFYLLNLGAYTSILAAVLGWIFQDYIKGVISYCHLYHAGLLHFGDWIIVQKFGISGMIIDCSLLTVTVRNWDNTISSLPMYSLQAESFQNNQEVLDGKTTGRRMIRNFVIDTKTVRVVSDEEKQQIANQLHEIGEDTIAIENAKDNSLNISLFRLYLRHWLMNNDDVCRFPRLIVTLKEPQPEGIPLEVYVFILKTRLAQFELVQSEIEEHILMTMPLFGLKLYQRLSSYDVMEEREQHLENSKETGYE